MRRARQLHSLPGLNMAYGLNLRPHERVFSAFFLTGIGFGSIFTRLGDIQVSMGVKQGALGAALIGTAIGMMISVTFFTPWLDRIGYKRVLLVTVPMMGALTTLASLSPAPAIMFVWLVLHGLMAGAASTVINVEADRTEHLTGRRIMNRCHAIYSFGFLSATLLGASAKQFGVSPPVHLLCITILLSAAIIAVWGRFTPAPARAVDADAKAPRFAVPSLAILRIGAFTLAGMIYEGAAADWGVIYMRDVFNAAPFVNGMALTFGSLAQAFSRFFSDRYVERFGPTAVARFMLAALGLGAALVTISPLWAFALVGFALMGAGNAVINPLAISAAARRTDRPATINVASLTQLSWLAFFAGPPLIGFAAERLGSRMTYGIALPLVILSFFLASTVLGGAEAKAKGRGFFAKPANAGQQTDRPAGRDSR